MGQAQPETAPNLFEKGDKIEVRVQNDAVVWCPATFLRSTTQNQILVQFDDNSTESDVLTPPVRKEHVRPGDVRPAPPPELHRYLKVGEMVEGFCRDKRGWRKGHVVEILENSKYSVSFEVEGHDDYVAEMEQWELRAFREWADGCWAPPFLLQEVLQKKTPEKEEGKPKGLVIKIKCSRKATKPIFIDGMIVEVKSDEKGFRGSLYTAVVVKFLGSDKYLVEYRTLRTEDKTELLKEEVNISCIRHCPPVIQRVLPFEYLDRVDAWYNDGWWEGYVVHILNACKYTVHFTNADEELVFEHCKLRPHQEWVDGKWSEVPKVNLNDLTLKRKRCEKALEPVFRDGTLVEVKSDEEGYQGSWYTAKVVSSLCSEMYLVEYQTLKTENESDLLTEKAFASYIRPCPPELVRVDRFRMLEEVDAWYNDGWWVGLVSKVLDGFKYAVYFWTTNEELIFEHSSMRPHQEWIDGKWVISAGENKKVVAKNRLGKCTKESDKTVGVEHFFVSEMRVEVKSDAQGYRGSWYPAVIVNRLGNRKYLVEYLTLKTDDGTHLHREEADTACIRPAPLVVQRKHPYKAFEEVDAWYNEGWWAGKIYQVLEGRKYTVYLNTTDEIVEFQHSELRPHRDWVDGQWNIAKKRGRPRSSLKRD